ncbi:DUF3597 domain-containing protein [Porphyrobacter sp. GA68]|uniref:DUF3597 domain-containing protein n=1 Tax=Porphyrobacter sp. GA68 TaxID=2883480 RepID=UPI001D194F27|nr:DUF3597 domain-containing protein [Porphyrobacter sp. GA68]
MSIFGKIKNAIFGGGDKSGSKTAASSQPSTPSRAGAVAPAGSAGNFPKTNISYAPGAEPQVMSDVDVERRLDGMTGADKLNWRTSVVDLMKLVGIDPSYENRKELATELGDTDYSGKAEENIWLHKRVMQELAKNGGKVPASLTD